MGQYDSKSQSPGESRDHIDVAAGKNTRAVTRFDAFIYVDI